MTFTSDEIELMLLNFAERKGVVKAGIVDFTKYKKISKLLGKRKKPQVRVKDLMKAFLGCLKPGPMRKNTKGAGGSGFSLDPGGIPGSKAMAGPVGIKRGTKALEYKYKPKLKRQGPKLTLKEFSELFKGKLGEGISPLPPPANLPMAQSWPQNLGADEEGQVVEVVEDGRLSDLEEEKEPMEAEKPSGFSLSNIFSEAYGGEPEAPEL